MRTVALAYVVSVLALGCSPALAQQFPMQGFGDEKPAKTQPPVIVPPSPGAGEQATAAPAPKKKKVARKAPPKERGVVSDDPRPTFTQDTLHLTQGAAERYRQIARNGGWPELPAGTALSVGAKGPLVLALRQRLALEGELPEDMTGLPLFDKPLAEAVRLFQGRHGLARTGAVAGATLRALNVPPEERARQLQMSAARLSGSTFAFGGRYVAVNIPSASVEAVENNFVRKRYVAVVGKPANASPQVEARIGAVNLNPTWTVPVSIIKNEIAPRMRRDPGYLARSRIRILDGRGNEVHPASIDWSGTQAVNYTFRQDSGAANALGNIRIDMPNRDSVYMHDTPSKTVFAAQDRFFSHGCVRVQDVKSFAAWLLEETSGGWDKPLIDAAIATGERRDIRLSKPVPVAWVYLTGYVTEDGKAHFRDDIYGLDQIDPALVAQRRAAQQAQAAARAPVVQQIDTTVTGSVPARGPWRLW